MTPIHHDHSADTARATMAGLPHIDGSAASTAQLGARFRPDRTLPIRVELARQLHRRRTQIALGFMVLLPLILATAFSIGSDNAGPSTSSFIDLAQSSAANFVMVSLFFSSSFLLIVVVSLFFGDTVASEASWSSLKYLLAMPVPRLRLLRQKLIVAAILSLAAVGILVAVAALVGLLVYGSGPLTTPTGVTFTGGETWWRVGLVVASMLGQLAWVAGLAFLMTVATDVPLGAVGTAVLLSIVSQILDQITALGSIRDWLPTHFSFAWTGAMVDPVSWFDITRGAFQSVAYAAALIAAAFLVFRRKDITS
jgi:ABC-2 type transport system permease protein